MNRILLSIVGVLAVLWAALFVSEQQVLVWETGGFNYDECVREHYEASSVHPFHCAVNALENQWDCTYFNGRRLVRRTLDPRDYGSCPNFRENK
jgi:hypothetical protein|tara:strand:- start:207 stop:488 length:282 start_codon:yes stop_codon:yes gene_type:complete